MQEFDKIYKTIMEKYDPKYDIDVVFISKAGNKDQSVNGFELAVKETLQKMVGDDYSIAREDAGKNSIHLEIAINSSNKSQVIKKLPSELEKLAQKYDGRAVI